MTIAPISSTQKTAAAPETPAPRAAAASAQVSATRFAEALDAAPQSAAPRPVALGIDRRGSQSETMSPAQKFESFVMRSFVEQMLPAENSQFYGEGMAGNVWRSMLAEEIGNEIARGGGVGIADMIAKQTPGAAESPDQARAALSRSNEAIALKLPR